MSSKKIGIITFHSSYNCGSMLQAYALQKFLKKKCYDVEIVDFSSVGQKKLYSVYTENKSLKMLLKNVVTFFHASKIKANFSRYETFKREQFNLSAYSTSDMRELKDDYYAVIAGADQIWNITISDYDDAYFLPWVTKGKKIAYAPSFGAKNIREYAKSLKKFQEYLNNFDSLSIRENNGRQWIEDLISKTVPVVLDPTLIIEREDYENIISEELELPKKYIFYYAPSFSIKINKLVKNISRKYKLAVIAFNTKAFYMRGVNFFGFRLPKFEDPSTYLQLMKNAEMVITTSFHGTVFSTVFRRKFWVIKNGAMFENDDRVITLVNQLGIEERLISMDFNKDFDYNIPVNYTKYDNNLLRLKKYSQDYLLAALETSNETAK